MSRAKRGQSGGKAQHPTLEPASASRFLWLTDRRIAIAVAIAAVGIRIWLSATLYLNPDEALHLSAATSRRWGAVYHPPLLLWWLWIASHVSEKEWWLRLLPSLAGGLSPVAAALWLRRFVSRITAWFLASLVGFAPILVYLTLQLRGYSLAILGLLIALVMLDRALDTGSRSALAWHYLALYLAILAEFSAAWVVLGIGVYGLLRIAREHRIRALLSGWVIGQAVAAFLYVGLYFYLMRPLLKLPHESVAFLDAFLLQPGQSKLQFGATGFLMQFVYIAGGEIEGWIFAALALVGFIRLVWTRDIRAVLVLAPYAVVIAAFAGLFPFGPTRHTVVIGLVSLAAVGIGIDLLARFIPGFKFAVPLIVLGLMIAQGSSDPMNIAVERWQKTGWEASIAHMESIVPPGSIVVTSGAVRDMLVAYRLPPDRRNIGLDYTNRTESPAIDGYRFLVFGHFYSELNLPGAQAQLSKRIEQLRAVQPDIPKRVWFLNGGWESTPFPPQLAVMNGPEIYLARLDR